LVAMRGIECRSTLPQQEHSPMNRVREHSPTAGTLSHKCDKVKLELIEEIAYVAFGEADHCVSSAIVDP
jgi:hypothetical protein